MTEPTLLDPLDEILVELNHIRALHRQEVEPLRRIADNARYMVAEGGYAGCVEDGVCEEELEPCPHVTTHYATCTDRLIRERLEYALRAMWDLLRSRPVGGDLAGALVDRMHATAVGCLQILDDADPRGEVERPEVLTEIAEACRRTRRSRSVWPTLNGFVRPRSPKGARREH